MFTLSIIGGWNAVSSCKIDLLKIESIPALPRHCPKRYLNGRGSDCGDRQNV